MGTNFTFRIRNNMAGVIVRPVTRYIPMLSCRMMSTAGDPGSGAGKGGGSGGSVRDAGGSMGKREAAQEEQYFQKLQHELLAKIKREHQEQCLYHDEEIKFHEDAISRHT